jgi:hypothetical protein
MSGSCGLTLTHVFVSPPAHVTTQTVPPGIRQGLDPSPARQQKLSHSARFKQKTEVRDERERKNTKKKKTGSGTELTGVSCVGVSEWLA